MAGWIKISKEINTHWIWKDPIKFQWWLDILLTVNYSDAKVNIGYKIFECKRGETLLSLLSWSKRWGVSKSVVNNFFSMLENDNMIETHNEIVTTRLKVCNYDSYQQNENAFKTETKRKQNGIETEEDPIEEKEKNKNKNKNRDAAKAATIKRVSDFKKSLYPFTIAKGGIYSNDTVKDFFEYWSELNKSETKMRWELQTTFQISKRLVTWLKNEKPKFGEPKQQTNIFKTTD